MKIKNMSWKADLLQSIVSWLQDNYPLIYGAILAGVIAYGRLIHDGVERKNKWIEALLCGLISFAISNGLELFGVPVKFSPFIGGMIGFIGVDKLRKVVFSVIDKKTGNDK